MKFALWLNFFPPTVGVSISVSPCIIFTEVKFDYNKHCQLPFIQYTQLHQDNTSINSQSSSTARSICLVISGNLPVVYNFFLVHTGHKITRQIWAALPVISVVYDQMNQRVISEVRPSLIIFDYWKIDTVGDYDNKIAVVEKLYYISVWVDSWGGLILHQTWVSSRWLWYHTLRYGWICGSKWATILAVIPWRTWIPSNQ